MNAPIKERSEAWIAKAREVMQARSLADKYAELEDKLFEELKVLSEGEPSRGGGFLLNKNVRKGSVDYSKIPELQFVDLENISQTTSNRLAINIRIY